MMEVKAQEEEVGHKIGKFSNCDGVSVNRAGCSIGGRASQDSGGAVRTTNSSEHTYTITQCSVFTLACLFVGGETIETRRGCKKSRTRVRGSISSVP